MHLLPCLNVLILKIDKPLLEFFGPVFYHYYRGRLIAVYTESNNLDFNIKAVSILLASFYPFSFLIGDVILFGVLDAVISEFYICAALCRSLFVQYH